jgi:ribosome-binding protein aMBF1 (putative translation factor)
MKSHAKRKCPHCKAVYIPDRRNLRHQRYCAKPDCQMESKRQSQRRWLAKPANQNYFHGPENSQRVREWRMAHQGYARRKIPAPDEPLQEVCATQAPQPRQVSVNKTSHALQEDITPASHALIRNGHHMSRFSPVNAPESARPQPPINSVGKHTMRFRNNIGPQMRRLRDGRGWSQSTFAAKLQIAGLDIDRSGVSKIECRLVCVNDKQLLYLAEALKVSVQDLFPTRQAGRFWEFMQKLETTRF